MQFKIQTTSGRDMLHESQLNRSSRFPYEDKMEPEILNSSSASAAIVVHQKSKEVSSSIVSFLFSLIIFFSKFLIYSIFFLNAFNNFYL